MHAQIRSVPALSPANLAAYLEVLSGAGINIQAAGGSDIEHGGEFAIGLADEDYDRAMQVLQGAGYVPRLVEVHYCALEDRPGELWRCINEAVQENDSTGFKIKDIAVGVPDAEGRIQVQIYSEAPAVEESAS